MLGLGRQGEKVGHGIGGGGQGVGGLPGPGLALGVGEYGTRLDRGLVEACQLQAGRLERGVGAIEGGLLIDVDGVERLEAALAVVDRIESYTAQHHQQGGKDQQDQGPAHSHRQVVQ